jgi:putative addiction module killer protein
MIVIYEKVAFTEWMRSLRDSAGRAKIASRIRRMAFGNFGDATHVGQGVSELRIHFGPGYRVYFVQRGSEIVILLCGGDKGSQKRDIETAHKMAANLEEYE